MSVEDAMTINERRKYLRQIQKRYEPAGRVARSRLLNEMEAVTGLHRKSLTRLMGSRLERQARTRQRGASYGAEVAHAIRVIAESLDWVCAERLQPNLAVMARHLATHGELTLSDGLLAKLGTVSVSTVRRILGQQVRDRPRLPRGGPEPANRVRREVPARRMPWHEIEPGHFEVDLVHHSGPSTAGDYVHTLQLIDVATGWSERVAVLGRSYLVMRDAFRRVLARLPFPVIELHPDNGSEFLNAHLVRFWREAAVGVTLSRSRPWHKNDNRFVEQKNATLVRAYLGDDRLDTTDQTNLLNALYDLMWAYYNLFQPVMRRREKTVLPTAEGHRIHRRFDAARTPFDRLRATGVLSCAQETHLNTMRAAINPRQLRQQIYATLDQLFALPNAQPGRIQDVFLTLFAPPEFTKGEDIPVTFSNDRTIPLR